MVCVPPPRRTRLKACHRILWDFVAHVLEVTGIGASVLGLTAMNAGSLEPVPLVEHIDQPRNQNQQVFTNSHCFRARGAPPAWPRATHVLNPLQNFNTTWLDITKVSGQSRVRD